MQIKTLEIQIENFKGLESLNTTLKPGTLHLIKGVNEVGKSSVLQAISALLNAKLDVPNPVMFSKENGTITGVIEDINGNKWSVNLDFDQKKSKFTLVNSDGLKTNSVTSIRDFFAYQDFTAEEFLSWSNNAEGRKKQIEIILNCLEKTALEEYNALTEKEKQEFAQRTPVIEQEKYFKKRLNEFVIDDLTKELLEKDRDTIEQEITRQKSLFEQIEANKTNYVSGIQELKNYEDLYNAKIRNFNSQKESMMLQVQNYQQQIQNLQELLQKTQNNIEHTQKDIEETKNKYQSFVVLKKKDLVEVKEEEYLLAKDSYDKAMQMKTMLDNAIKLQTEANQIQLHYEEQKSLLDKLNTSIEKIRQEKKDILKKSNIVENVFIEDDGLYIQNEKGYFPLNDNQISTSASIKVAIQLLIKLNEKFPIITLGRAESLSKENLDYLNQLAIEHNAIIVAEQVNTNQEIQIEIYDNTK